MRIYLTHCSKEKSLDAKASGLPVSPDILYTEAGIQEFMTACMHAGVTWAILSDNYGVLLPGDQRVYYEKPPATVTAEEELVIIHQLEQKLSSFDDIWFFVRTATFHPFYERVLNSSSLNDRITFFKDLNSIKG
jgi:hypothetical protein